MADLGFADYYEALEVYRELDPASVRIGEQPSPRANDRRRAPGGDGAALRVPDGAGRETRRHRRLGVLARGAEADRRRRAGRSPLRAGRAHQPRARRRSDRARRRRGGGGGARAPGGHARSGDGAPGARGRRARRGGAAHHPAGAAVSRWASASCGKVKRLALTLRREGPFGAQGFNLAETDDATVLEAVSRLRPMFPRLLDDPPSAGERPVPASRRSRAGGRRHRASRRGAGDGAGPRASRPRTSRPAGRRSQGPASTPPGSTSACWPARRWWRGCSTEGRPKRAAQPVRFRPLAPAEVKAFEAMSKAPRSKDKAPKLPVGAREERPRDPDRGRAAAARRGRGERRRALARHPCASRAGAGERPTETTPQIGPNAPRKPRRRRCANPTRPFLAALTSGAKRGAESSRNGNVFHCLGSDFSPRFFSPRCAPLPCFASRRSP